MKFVCIHCIDVNEYCILDVGVKIINSNEKIQCPFGGNANFVPYYDEINKQIKKRNNVQDN